MEKIFAWLQRQQEQRAFCLWWRRTGSLLIPSHHWSSRNEIALGPECSASTCCQVFLHWHVIAHGSQGVTWELASTKVSRKHSGQHNSAWHCSQRKTFHSRDSKKISSEIIRAQLSSVSSHFVLHSFLGSLMKTGEVRSACGGQEWLHKCVTSS